MGVWLIPGNYFSIGMSRCFMSYTMMMALMDVRAGRHRQQQQQNQCTAGDEEDVQVSKMGLPYDCAVFDFNFFGGLADAIMNKIGLDFLKTMTAIATNEIMKKVNFLICGA